MDPTDMQAHIGDVRQAVRYAGADCATQELPGFCMLKKVRQCTLYCERTKLCKIRGGGAFRLIAQL